MSIPGRIGELNRLVEHARHLEVKDEPLYNTICRSAIVLCSAHLEGYLKDLVSSVVADLNSWAGGFDRMPKAMQRAFCEKIAFYEGVPKTEIESRITQLIRFFSQNSVPIDLSIINYKESNGRNPNVAFIKSMMNKIGVPDIVSSMEVSPFHDIFFNIKERSYLLQRDITRFRATLYRYPYRPLPSAYQFDYRSSVGTKTKITLWHTFIEQILTRRHKVAHGDTLENETTCDDLQADVQKLGILMHCLAFASAGYVTGMR